MVKVMVSFQEGREDSGPFQSHKRIIESDLNKIYEFAPLILKQGKLSPLNIKLIYDLIKQIRSYKPDIIHIHGLQLAGLYYMIAAKMCRKKVVLVVRGSSLEAINCSSIKKKVLREIENWTLKQATIYYGVSQYVSNWDCLKRYPMKNAPPIYNMSIENTIDTGNLLRTDLGLSDKDVVISSSGRIVDEKGFDILSRLIIKMEKYPNIKFIIIGDGVYLPKMKSDLINNHNVIFTGAVKNVKSYLQISDIFVICTKHETFCNSIIEAQSIGLPVVATNVGGIPEIIIDGFNGFLFNIGDEENLYEKVLQLYNDKLLRSIMSDNSLIQIKRKFNNSNIIKQINDIYQRCLKSGNK